MVFTAAFVTAVERNQALRGLHPMISVTVLIGISNTGSPTAGALAVGAESPNPIQQAFPVVRMTMFPVPSGMWEVLSWNHAAFVIEPLDEQAVGITWSPPV
jgi:hypothetical protein